MNSSELLAINPVLMDRVRLAIIAQLSLAKGPIDFNFLLDALSLTKGNLSSHLRKLEEAEFINVDKQFVDRKPRSSYSCTRKGTEEFRKYLSATEALLVATKGTRKK